MNRTGLSKSQREALLAGAALTSLLAAASGCGPIGEGPEGPQEQDNAPSTPADEGNNGGGGSDNNGGPTGGGNPPPPVENCADIGAEAKQILQVNCAKCHGADSRGDGGFNTILSANGLIAGGYVTPGKPDTSKIYIRMGNDSMPPKAVAQRPSDVDKKTIADWIACGALDFDQDAGPAAAYLGVNERIALMRDHLENVQFKEEAELERTRFIDFSNLSNAGLSAAQLEEYRDAVTLLLNSLTYAQSPVPGTFIDRDRLLYVIDLEDYLWVANDWNTIAEDYPYQVRYKDSQIVIDGRPVFERYEEEDAQLIRDFTQTDVPYIQADWLLAHASRPPIYYDVLRFSGQTLGQIALSRGVNIQRNINDFRVTRAGFLKSGVSSSNRIIEEHPIPGQGGGSFWLSYDFAGNAGAQNIFENPLDFEEDGGEVIFSLPNGLQAYIVANAAGTLLDKAPTNIVVDPGSADSAVEAGLSCMNCHNPGGTIPKEDELLEASFRSQFISAAEREVIARLYPGNDVVASKLEAGKRTYQEALASAGIKATNGTTMHRVVDAHEGELSPKMVAAVLGVSVERLLASLDTTPVAAFEPLLENGSIAREVLEVGINDLIEALDLGEQINTNNLGGVN